MKPLPIKPYLYMRTAQSPVYHPNGKKISFITNYTGVPQVWEYEKGAGWPVQISFTEDRISFVDYIEKTEQRIIGMDQGGNERHQLFLLHDDGEVTPLTDAPDYIHQYGGSSPDGKWIAWSSNRRHPAFFDLYIQNLETLEIRRVLESSGYFSIYGWHPDGTHLLMGEHHSNLDNDLGLLDLENGKVDWLTKHDGEALFTHPQFSLDGKALYLLSNVDQEFKGLARMDLPEKKWTWLDQQDWGLQGLTLSEDGKTLAYTMNEGGISQGFLYDLESGDKRNWSTPMGVIGQLTFSPDSSKLAFVFNGPKHPTDIWELDIHSLQMERLTYASQSPTVEKRLVEPEIITFPSFDEREIPSFYYKPQDQEGPYPVVVYVHGGPEGQTQATFNPVIQYLVNRGFAVAAPNVRGSTGYGKTFVHLDDVRKRMDSVKDLVALVEWLQTKGNADPNKIAVMGGSYGGFMVLAALTHYPDLWAAGVDIVGISNFRTFLENTGPWRRKMREAEYGSIEQDGAFFDEISPIHHTNKITAPLMVIHGANDPRVPIGEAEQIVEDLRERKRPVEYLRFEDEGHGIVKLENRMVAYPETADFLEKWLQVSNS